jgi:hypothetical protein
MAEISEPIGTSRNLAPARSETWDQDAGFYFTMSLLTATIIVLGFVPSFYLKSVIHAPPPLTLLTITHGVVFTAWLALVVVQSGLIAARKPAPHRLIGMLGAILFGAMISLGLSTAITAGRLGHAPPGAPPALAFMALPFIAMIATAGLVAAALVNRRRSDWHKRLMLAGFFAMTGPGVHRLAIGAGLIDQAINLVFVVNYLLLAMAFVYDYTARKRIHPAYHLAAVVFVAVHVSVLWAFGSSAWLTLAKGITA